MRVAPTSTCVLLAAALFGSLVGGSVRADEAWPLLVSRSETPALDAVLLDGQRALERERLLIAPRRLDARRNHATLEIEHSNALGWLCGQRGSVAPLLGPLDQGCAQWQLGEEDPLIGMPRQQVIGAEIGFSLPEQDLHFGLGATWLASDAFSDGAADAGIIVPLREGFVEGFSQLSVSAQHGFGVSRWIRLTGSQTQLRASSIWASGPLRDWSQSALTFDAGVGAFSGSVRGHRNQSPWWPQPWSDVDLGISWKTPWAGQITVGARNVLGNAPKLPDTSEAIEPESRVPYVRYQQDL